MSATFNFQPEKAHRLSQHRSLLNCHIVPYERDCREAKQTDNKCPVCKKTYTTFDPKKKYCSDACARQANRKK